MFLAFSSSESYFSDEYTKPKISSGKKILPCELNVQGNDTCEKCTRARYRALEKDEEKTLWPRVSFLYI